MKKENTITAFKAFDGNFKSSLVMERIRNNSKLTYDDCMIQLTGEQSFNTMLDDDLDSIYACAFNRWAYHLTRQGYIDSLNKRRLELLNEREETLRKIELSQNQ